MADRGRVTQAHVEAVHAVSERLAATQVYVEPVHAVTGGEKLDVTQVYVEPVHAVTGGEKLDVTQVYLEVVHDIGPTGEDKAYVTQVYLEVVHDVETDDDDPSEPVSGECDGKFGTLSIPLDWPVVLLRGSRVSRLKLDSGHTIRLARAIKQRRRWQVQMKAATPAEKAELLDFWDAHLGVQYPYDWTTPQGELVSGRFYRPGLDTALRNPGVDSYRFEIEEVFC